MDSRIESGLGYVRRAFPGTTVRVIRAEAERRANACLVKLILEERRLYQGSVRAERDGTATVYLRRGDFTPWTVYHEIDGHLFHGHVCAPAWQYYVVELWPMDLILLMRASMMSG